MYISLYGSFPCSLAFIFPIIFFLIVFFEYQMGPCMSSTPRALPPTYHYDQSLEVQTPRAEQLSHLSFHSTIANLILKKYTHKVAVPVFRLVQGQSFKLPAKQRAGDESIKWKFQQKFDFEMSEYQLKKSFLHVEIYNEQHRIVGSIKINLFLIATGPIHQDFAIQYEKGNLGRINFDLKLSQIIEVKIRAKAAQIELLKDHPGQEFSYSIKTIAGYNGQASESECSYPAIVLLQKKVLEIQQEKGQKMKMEGYMSLDNERKKSVKEVETGKHIVWHNQNGKLPVLTTKVLASELHNTYFQVLIWKSQGTAQQKEELFADTYVSFYKLFATEGIRIGQEGSELQSRDISIAQKIQHYGKDYGKGTFTFNIANEPYFKQYQICVHTEAGILKTAPIFGEEKAKSKEICIQLKELQLISEKTEQDVIKLNNLYSTISYLNEIRKVKAEIQLNLERMFNFLEKSSHLPSFLYEYNSQGQLLQGQQILVQLGIKTIEYLQLQDPIINDVCWLILISLVKRSEFSLGHMGFNEKNQKQLLNGEISIYLTKKLKLAGIFKNFTYKLLDLALSALNRKGSQYQSIFAEVYCACAYFKIPQFRKEVLKLITNQADPEINEWRGVQFNLHDDIEESYIRNHANIFSQLFDWQPHFYRWITHQEQTESLSDILSQKEWKQKFQSRGLQFFYFIKYWVTYIESNLPLKKDIQWRYFPGYNRILQGFFAQMKKTPILQYPDALIESCLKLLANEKLVNPIMTIMLNKVNVFNPSAVIRGIEFLNLIFKTFTKKKKFLPIYFNYSYFFKCLKIIFESQSCIGISSALTLIYNHFNLYHIEFRRSLSMYLLGKIFWKLFLHWSHAVRNPFHHLITYRIYGQAYYSQTITSSRFMISDSDIMERYKQIMKIASNKEKQYEQSRLGSFDNFVDQNYFKKMKLKAYHKIRQLSDSSSNNITKASIEVKEISDTKDLLGRPRKELQKSHNLLKQIQDRGYHSQHSSNLKKETPLQGKAQDDNFWEEPCHQFVLFQKIIHQDELEIQEIDRYKLKYLATYLPEFKKIERSFIHSLEKQDHSCPLVSYQISIDNREIRPKEIDNW